MFWMICGCLESEVWKYPRDCSHLRACLHIYLHVFRTKVGRATIAVGENEAFSKLSGLDISRIRLIAIIVSTVIAGFGICVYSQSYGFIQLYDEPLSMAFPAISAVLIGGSTGKKAYIFEAVLGTYLLQTMYLLTVPIANEILIPELTEILRTFITYGIILYALLIKGRRGTNCENKGWNAWRNKNRVNKFVDSGHLVPAVF